MQLSLIDPRIHPVATAAMLHDVGLKQAIRMVRLGKPGGWPFVEHLVDVAGRPAWAVEDDGMRYVVVGAIIFWREDFDILNEKIRTAAQACFGRLDAIGRAA